MTSLQDHLDRFLEEYGELEFRVEKNQLLFEGEVVHKGEAVELSEKDPETGTCRRSIVRSLNAASYGIQPIEFLFN